MDGARDPRRLDLDLLRLFVAAFEERHLTRAAKRLFLSQSAASQRLTRLRAHFDDPLFVATGRGMAPTARAESLYASVLPALEKLEAAVTAQTPFDPARDDHVFRLGTSDLTALVVMPSLLARLRQEAPQVRLVVRVGDHRRLAGMLGHGEVQTLLGYLGEHLPANARQRGAGTMHWVVLRDAATPPVTSLEAFCARPHAMVTPAGDLRGMVDDALDTLGMRRTIMVGLSDFGLLGSALQGSDLVAVAPAAFAARLCATGHFAMDELPVSLAVSAHGMAWSATAHHDPAERWFRSLLFTCYEAALADGRANPNQPNAAIARRFGEVETPRGEGLAPPRDGGTAPIRLAQP